MISGSIHYNILTMKRLSLTIILLLSLSACARNESKHVGVHPTLDSIKYKQEAIDLNDQALQIIRVPVKANYLEALELLDKAITVDSSYFMAYATKANILANLQRYDEAMEVLNHLVTKVKPDDAEAYTFIGMLYEKKRQNDSARMQYEEAIRIYTNKIKMNPDEIMLQVTKAKLIYIIDQEKGLHEMDSLINRYPKNTNLPLFKQIDFLEYDHQQMIDQL